MAGAGAVGRLGRPVELSLGRFLLEVPDAWVSVPAEVAGRDDVLVFDISPETAHQGHEVVHPTVALRHFTEPADGNVASASFREAFLGGQEVVEGFLLLSYEAFFTGRGLPGRRHHVIGWEEALAWHSVRWYVGSGAEIVELTLTAEAGADLELWGGQCDRMIRSVVFQGAPEPASNLCWPEVPVDVRAEDSWEVVTEQGLNPPWLESLRAGYDAVQEQDPWSAWAAEPSLEQRRVLEQELPILSGVGERSGQGFRVEICLDGRGGAVVVVVPEGDGDGTNVRRGVRTVPVSLVVPVLLTWAGLRADWLRDEVMEAPGDVAPTEMAELCRGRWGADGVGSEASADWWRWWNQEGEVVAEWVQPLHRAPLAVFRDESRCVGVPVMPGVLYSVLQSTVQEIAGSPHM